MRKDDYKQFVTGNLGKKKNRGLDGNDKFATGHDHSAPARVNKVMKRDKGH